MPQNNQKLPHNEHVFILFQLYGIKAWLIEGNIFSVGQFGCPQPSYWEKN